MSWTKRLLPVVIIAFVLLILIVLGGRRGWFKRYIAEPLQSKFSVTIDRERYHTTDSGIIVHEPTLVIGGKTNLPAHLRLTRDSYTLAEGDTDPTKAFEFRDIKLNPGRNLFRIEAESKVAWRALEADDAVEVQFSPQKPSTPLLTSLPQITSGPRLWINGTADPTAMVTMTFEQLPAPNASPSALPSPLLKGTTITKPAAVASPTPELTAVGPASYAGVDGRFSMAMDLPVPGDYAISAYAKDLESHRSDASPKIRVKYDPEFYQPPFRKIRHINIAIGYRELRVIQEVVLSKDDPMLADLISGRTGSTQFMPSVFGWLNVNDRYVIDDLPLESKPLIKFQGNTAIVTFDSGTDPSADWLPPFNGPLKISSFNSDSFAENEITVSVKDYRLEFVTPPPTDIQDSNLVWTSTDATAALGRGIEAKLTSDLSAHPLRFFQLTPGDVFPSSASRWLTLLTSLIPTIPFVWLLWLCRRDIETGWAEEQWPATVKRSVRRLLIWTILPVTLNLLYMTPTWYYRLKGRPELVDRFAVGVSVFVVSLLLLALISRRFRDRGWAFWLGEILRGLLHAATVALVVGAELIVAAMSSLGYYQTVTVILLSPLLFVFLRTTWRWLKMATGKTPAWSEVRPGVLTSIVFLLVSVALTYPTNNFYFDIFADRVATWERIQSAFAEFFFLVSRLAPYALIPMLLFVLRRQDRHTIEERQAAPNEKSDRLFVSLGTLLFAAYIIGLDSGWFWIPIPFLLGLLTFPRLVLIERSRRHVLLQKLPPVLRRRRSVIKELSKRMNVRQLASAVTKLEKKLNSGDLSVNDFAERKKQITESLEKIDKKTAIAGLRGRDVVLSVGPFPTNWQNGIAAARKSIYLIAPFLVLYVTVFLLKEVRWYFPLMPLWAVVQLSSFIADGLIGAFFFGFFFNVIRGSSGLKKGINVSLVVVLCLLPSWIAPLSSSSLSNLLALLFRAGQTFLFYMIIGVWAFDYRNYRHAVKQEFQWKKFALFGDMPSATAFISVALTSAGVAVTTVLTGQFTSVLTQILKVAIPTMSVGPPGK